MKKIDDGGVGAGIAWLAVQLVFVREKQAQLHDNPIAMDLMLFSWLVPGGFGTAAARGPGLRLAPPTVATLLWPCLPLGSFLSIHQGYRLFVFPIDDQWGSCVVWVWMN